MSKVIKESDLESPVSKVISPDDLETPIKATGHGASGSWKEPDPTIMQRVAPYLPSWRTAAQVAGGAVGALAGPEGVLPGVGIGESVYQLGQHLTKDPNAPQTSGEAALAHSDALGSAALGEAIPFAAKWHGEHPLLPMLSKYATGAFNRLAPSAIKTSAQTFATRGLGTDPTLQRYMETGLSELKAAEDIMGPIKTIPKAQNALRLRGAGYSDAIDNGILKGQEDIVVPGSAQRARDVQIAALPHDMSAARRLVKVRDINNSVPIKDYTQGELNHLRSELAATQSPYYGKDLSGQLTMDASTRAVDIARGNWAREELYSSLDKYGMGGGKEAREINGRIGGIINWQDALRSKTGTAVAQKETIQAILGKKMGKVVSPLQTIQGTNRTTEENLALALKRWESRPTGINPSVGERVRGTVGSQQDLIPGAHVPPKPVEESETTTPNFADQGNLFDQYRAETGKSSEREYRDWLKSKSLWNKGLPKPPAVGTQGEIQEVPGGIGHDSLGPNGEYQSARDEYETEQARRKVWDKGLSAKEREIRPPSGGQQNLSLPNRPIQKGVSPSPLFGINQNIPEGITPGTIFSHKQRMLDGSETWKYVTPEGKTITSDHEIPPEVLKSGYAGPYEPGTSHSGIPQPPKRQDVSISDKTTSGGNPLNISGPAPKRPGIDRGVDYTGTNPRIRALTERVGPKTVPAREPIESPLKPEPVANVNITKDKLGTRIALAGDKDLPAIKGGSNVTSPGIGAGESGYIVLGDPVGPYVNIDMVYVRKAARGEGQSLELYREALKEAKRQGYKGIASSQVNRSSMATNAIWDKYKTGTFGEHDVMETPPTKPISDTPTPPPQRKGKK